MLPGALHALCDALAELAGEAVTYTSAAAGTSTVLVAVRGRSQMQIQQTDGAILESLSHDWLIRRSDLDELGNAGDGYTPAKGDTITTMPSPFFPQAQTFELMAPPYSPSDHQGLRLRLHSVRTI